MSQHRLEAYQIEVLDFSKRKNQHRSDAVIADGRGAYRCRQCHWEGEHQGRCPNCGSELYQKGRIKAVDMLPTAPRRTLVELFYNPRGARKWGSRFGTVISCKKVDKSHYLENIEHLNLEQETMTIELEQEDYVLTRTLELERPRKVFEEKKYEVEIERGIDKE